MAQRLLAKHRLDNLRVLADVPPTAEGHWTCQACARTDRWLGRVRCECGSYASISSVNKALAARRPKTADAEKPPWKKGGRKVGPKKPPVENAGAAAAKPPTNSLTDEGRELFVAGLPPDLAATIRAHWETQAAVLEAPLPEKPPANQVQAERAHKKAERQHAAAEKRRDEAIEARRKAQEEVDAAEEDLKKKQVQVTEAASVLKDLCAAQLSTAEQIIAPSAAALANPQFKARFEALKAMQADLASEELPKQEAEAKKAAARRNYLGNRGLTQPIPGPKLAPRDTRCRSCRLPSTKLCTPSLRIWRGIWGAPRPTQTTRSQT